MFLKFLGKSLNRHVIGKRDGRHKKFQRGVNNKRLRGGRDGMIDMEPHGQACGTFL